MDVTKPPYVVGSMDQAIGQRTWTGHDLVILVPTLNRPKKLRELLDKHNFKGVDGGETHYDSDDKVTRCYLIPRFEYKQHFMRFTYDGRRWLTSLEL